MALQDLLVKYNEKTVKTGQDLINLGVIPKDFPSHLSIVALKRLQAIRDQIASVMSAEMVGEWEQIVEYEELRAGEVVTDPAKILKLVKPGMKVKGVGSVGVNKVDGLDGIVQGFSKKGDQIAVEFDRPLLAGVTGEKWCKPGYGAYLPPDAMKLYGTEDKPLRAYKLAQGVVADKKLGHKVRFKVDYEGPISDTNTPQPYTLEKLSQFPKGTIATLTGVSEDKGYLSFKLDSKIRAWGDRTEFTMRLENALDAMEASSLGGEAPKNLEEEVKKETMISFFPKSVLEPARAERIVLALMMSGKDHFLFYGMPGSGKSQTAKDIVEIAKQIVIRFVVPDCQVGCNPFSLFDPEFAKVVPACEECMEKYDPNYKKTKIFHAPKPKDVPVQVVGFSEGHGIEFVEGTVDLMGQDLRGYKLPQFNNSDPNNHDYDPNMFNAGIVSRTNNGMFIMEDCDKLRQPTQDHLLMALSEKRVKPDQMRVLVPANSLMIATANDETQFSEAFNDRVFLIAIRYPEDEDTLFRIIRSTYYGEGHEASQVDIGDTHVEPRYKMSDTPIPSTMVRAIGAMYKKFRNENKDEGKKNIMGSQRCINDSLDATAAMWIVDNLFFEEMPSMPNQKYVIAGIQFAIDSRVQIQEREKSQKTKETLNAWVEEQYPIFLRAEEKEFWCNVTKKIAIRDKQVEGTIASFTAEIETYRSNPEKAVKNYTAVKAAMESPRDEKLAKARIMYPFMDFLFKEQPLIKNMTTGQVTDLVAYHVASYEGLEQAK